MRADILFLVGLSLTIAFLIWEATLWPSGGGTPSCKSCVLVDDAGFAGGLSVLVVGVALSFIARRRRTRQEEDRTQARREAVENQV